MNGERLGCEGGNGGRERRERVERPGLRLGVGDAF